MHSESLPASYAQSRLWILDQVIEDKATYNVNFAYELKGCFSIDALNFSFKQMIQRHEVLRTCFRFQLGHVNQIINSELDFEITVISNFQNKSLDDVMTFIQKKSSVPFELDQTPLMRVFLLQLSSKKHVLAVIMHHIITDGWSLGVFSQELVFYYNSFLAESEEKLPELPIQYGDFTLWHNEWLQGEVLEKQLAYWERELSNSPELVEFPLDYPRPEKSSFRGHVYTFAFSSAISSALKKLAIEENVTTFILLLTLFKVLFHKLTGKNDSIIGIPVANRHYQGVEKLIGFFVNTIAIRCHIDAYASFRNILVKVKEKVIRSYDNQDAPFDKVLERLSMTRRQNYHPVFQNMFVLQNAGELDLQFNHLIARKLPVSSHGAKFDILMSAQEHDGIFHFDIEYALDIFELETIRQIAYAFQVLTERIIENPSVLLKKLQCIPKVMQTVCHKNQSIKEKFVSIFQAFESVTNTKPNSVALCCENRTVTYEELSKITKRLGLHLFLAGAKPGHKIVVCVDQSENLPICFLAILKIGCCYTPIDPSSPRLRTEAILKDTNAKIVLTESQYRENFSNFNGKCFFLDQLLEEDINNQSDETFHDLMALNMPAYLVYTSGTKGVPKGVVVTHRNLLHSTQARFYHYQEYVQAVLLMHSIAFDVAIASMSWALLTGAKLILPGKRGHRDIDYMINLIKDHGVSHFLCQPTLYQLILERAHSGTLQSLKEVAVGGETWPKKLLKLHCSKAFQSSLYNEYGPTEATVWTSYKKVYEAHSKKISPITIGKPIINSQIFIMDKDNCLLPSRIPGEICIEGEGVTAGYFNDPKLTAEKFIITNEGNSERRIYKTGDYGRCLENGEIELLGRMDSQVKIRGYRVELQEIESVIAQYKGVSQVTVVEQNVGESRLAAYIVPDTTIYNRFDVVLANEACQILGGEFSNQFLESLRTHLHMSLQEYMIPSFLVIIDQIPLTLSDKVNKSVLPNPSSCLQYNSNDFDISSLNELQQFLYNTWKEVLDFNNFNLTSNFFQAGGNSLSAIQVIARIRDELNISLPLNAIFENPTILKLELTVQKFRSKNRLYSVPELRKFSDKVKTHIPLSCAQERYWKIDKSLEDKVLYNMPVAIRFIGDLNIDALKEAFIVLLDRHESLRVIFREENDEPYQIILPFIDLEEIFKIYVLSSVSKEQKENFIKNLISKDLREGFILNKGPLIRIKLVKKEDNEHILFIVQHHIISDGWSIRVIFKELSFLYNCINKNEKINLPPLDIEYSDFAYWQQKFLNSFQIEEQFSYWEEKLKNFPIDLNLPLDYARPNIFSYKGANCYANISLPSDQWNLCGREGISSFMLLLCIFNLLLHCYTHQNDILIGTVVAKRDRKELENLVGLLINLIPIRIKIDQDTTFMHLLRKTKQASIEAYSHSDIPFDYLVNRISLQPQPNKKPLFQVIFMLHESFNDYLEFNNLSVRNYPFEYNIAKYDLKLETYQSREMLKLRFEYATDLFKASTIQSMCDSYETILKICIGNPNVKINEIVKICGSESILN